MASRAQARPPARKRDLRSSHAPGPDVLRDLLGHCDGLQDWARLQGFGLEPEPADLALLDEAIDRVIDQHGRHTQVSAIGNEAGQFLGTVIVSTIHGAHWRLWPNGHPVARLASGRDLDVSPWPMTG